jgi:hypothetical protein
MDICSKTAGDSLYRKMNRVAIDGDHIGDPMEPAGLHPPLLWERYLVGERSCGRAVYSTSDCAMGGVVKFDLVFCVFSFFPFGIRFNGRTFSASYGLLRFSKPVQYVRPVKRRQHC